MNARWSPGDDPEFDTGDVDRRCLLVPLKLDSLEVILARLQEVSEQVHEASTAEDQGLGQS